MRKRRRGRTATASSARPKLWATDADPVGASTRGWLPSPASVKRANSESPSQARPRTRGTAAGPGPPTFSRTENSRFHSNRLVRTIGDATAAVAGPGGRGRCVDSMSRLSALAFSTSIVRIASTSRVRSASSVGTGSRRTSGEVPTRMRIQSSAPGWPGSPTSATTAVAPSCRSMTVAVETGSRPGPGIQRRDVEATRRELLAHPRHTLSREGRCFR